MEIEELSANQSTHSWAAAVSTASCAGLKIDMLEPYHKCFEECVVNLHRVNVVDSYLYNLVSKDPI